jgi:glutamine---fructose-6-phosphate transaminase (isomerizing)
MSQYEKEILEQPEAIKRIFEHWAADKTTLRNLGEEFQLKNPELVFVGMGSSNFAPMILRSRLSKANIRYQILEAGELYHYELGQIQSDSWVIAISQSGESIETKKVVEKIHGKVQKVISITNEQESSLARLADVTLLLQAEKEVGSTTKTFVNTLLGLHLFIDALLGEVTVNQELTEELVSMFEKQTPILKERMKEVIEYLNLPSTSTQEPIHLIARGPMISTAMQTALILAETTDLFVQAIAGGTFRHGPKELAGEHHRAIVFAPSGKTQNLLIKIATEIHDMGSKVVLVSDAKGTFPFMHVELPTLPEDIAPLLYFLPIEWFGLNVSLLRGRTPGMMRHMDKVTTVE